MNLRRHIRRLRRIVRSRYRPVANDGLIRVNLGCGDDYRQGWVNVDRDPSVQVDIRANLAHVGDFLSKGSVEQIEMIHSVSYLPLWEARDLFAEARRLLRPNGSFVIETPDLRKCAAVLSSVSTNDDLYLEAVRAVYAFDLDQLRQRRRYQPYAFGWSAAHLIGELGSAGFTRVIEAAPQTHGPRPWRDVRVEAQP